MILPLRINLTHDGKVLNTSEPGPSDGADTVEYTLFLTPTESGVYAEYYSVEGTPLDDSMVEDVIAMMEMPL